MSGPQPPVFEPRYTPRLIASCPEHCCELEDEGFSYWCPEGRHSLTPMQVATFDEGERDD